MLLKICRNNFFKEKTMNKALTSLILIAVISGCASVTQHVPIADITAPIPSGKAIIELHRTSSMIGGARGADIYDNKVLIGDIGNGTKLIWERDSNSYMCLSIDQSLPLFLVNPLLILALEGPKHPDCFKIEEGKVNKFIYNYPAGTFHYEKK
jgi:hypothetical protein